MGLLHAFADEGKMREKCILKYYICVRNIFISTATQEQRQ